MPDPEGQAPPAAPPVPPQEGTTDPPTAPEAGAPEKTYSAAYVAQLRAENANARTKLREFESAEEARNQAAMTEAQKVAARAEKAERERDQLRRQVLVRDVAAKHGLTPDHYDFLHGADEAAIDAQAVKLAALVKGQVPLPADPTPPVPIPDTRPRPMARASNPGTAPVNDPGQVKARVAAAGLRIPGVTK